MRKFLKKGRSLLIEPQTSILSAASVIMIMIMASAALGIIRDRVLLHFFVPSDFSLFKAAFRFPDLFTSVLALGALSSAFIPVFTKTYNTNPDEAWDVAERVVNLGALIFLVLVSLFWIFSEPIYSVVTPGFSRDETIQVANIARVIFLAQGFFVISYVLTGVLESARRFLVPALAPMFYNLGIIIGTVVFAPKFGITGSVIGVLIGALMHLAIQFPLAYKLGFRFRLRIVPTDGVKKIAHLAAPRMLELSILQFSRVVELALSSLISTAAYGYYTLAVSVQSLPVSLFGLSLAKAALPTLSRQDDNPAEFKKTLLSALYQISFLVMPIAVVFMILRIPIVRLLFGTNIFDWNSTVQTGLVISAFAFGIPFQAANALLARAFYAMHQTKTPVFISLTGTFITIVIDFILVRGFGLPTWALAVAFSVGSIFQACTLFFILSKKLNGGIFFAFGPIIKSLTAAISAGSVMYFILKFFDRSVWVKKLSFLQSIDATKNLNFEKFVLDTRYTGNLLMLTIITALIGMLIYIGVSFILRSNELSVMVNMLTKKRLSPPPSKEKESITSTTPDTPQV